MQRPSNWDSVPAQTFSQNERPPAGAYVFGIVKEDHTPSRSNKDMTTLFLDIAEGEHKGFYKRLSESINKDCLLRHYRVHTEDSLPYFKGDIKAIEESNQGFTYNFTEGSLRGKLVGGMIREEEYFSSSGEVKTSNKIMFLCSAAKARDGSLKPPPTKKLDTSFNAPQQTTDYRNEKLPWE